MHTLKNLIKGVLFLMSEKELRELVTKLLKIQLSSKNDNTKLLAHALLSALDSFFEGTAEDFTATQAVLSVHQSYGIKGKFYDGRTGTETEKTISSLYGFTFSDDVLKKSFTELAKKLKDFSNFIVFHKKSFKITLG